MTANGLDEVHTTIRYLPDIYNMTKFSKEIALSIIESEEKFSVDFDGAWQWVEYSRKSDALKVLKANFEEGTEFCGVCRKTPNGGRPSISYRLTAQCFKEFCMMAGTAKGKEVRHYFIKCERQLKEQNKKLSQKNTKLSFSNERALVNRDQVIESAHDLALQNVEQAKTIEAQQGQIESQQEQINLLLSEFAQTKEMVKALIPMAGERDNIHRAVTSLNSPYQGLADVVQVMASGCYSQPQIDSGIKRTAEEMLDHLGYKHDFEGGCFLTSFRQYISYEVESFSGQGKPEKDGATYIYSDSHIQSFHRAYGRCKQNWDLKRETRKSDKERYWESHRAH